MLRKQYHIALDHCPIETSWKITKYWHKSRKWQNSVKLFSVKVHSANVFSANNSGTIIHTNVNDTYNILNGSCSLFSWYVSNNAYYKNCSFLKWISERSFLSASCINSWLKVEKFQDLWWRCWDLKCIVVYMEMFIIAVKKRCVSIHSTRRYYVLLQ